MVLDRVAPPAAGDRHVPVRRLISRQEITAALEQDLPYTAYLLRETEAFPWGGNEWYLWEDDDQQAFCYLERTRRLPPLLLMGAPAGVASLLQAIPLPWETWITCLSPHLVPLETAYRLAHTQTMLRMVATAGTFQPTPGAVTRLKACHLGALSHLYRGLMPGKLSACSLEEEVYYGIWEGAELVAVAGTHFTDRTRGIAAVGNVLTHPQYRNRGYATHCTSAVTEELLESYRQVILSVDVANTPAYRAYCKLGYQPHCAYVSGRGTLHPPASWQRPLAWLRGHYRQERSNGA